MVGENLGDQLDALLLAAQAQSGRGALTTHDAKSFFRSVGRGDLADRIHELLCKLADRASVPGWQAL